MVKMKKKEKTDYDLRRWRQLCNLHSILKIDVILHSNYICFYVKEAAGFNYTF